MEYKYQIPPTWLDSFKYHKDHEEDESTFHALIDKLNGVKSVYTEENLKGIQFEGIINDLIDNKPVLDIPFKMDIVNRVFDKLKRCTGKQVKREGVISTKYGNVRLHGIFDYEFPQMTADLKTTSNYSLKTDGDKKIKKFTYNFQHRVTFLITDKIEFNYVITDFDYMYLENFKRSQVDNGETIKEIELFIEFIEDNKDLIKNSKVFV